MGYLEYQVADSNKPQEILKFPSSVKRTFPNFLLSVLYSDFYRNYKADWLF